MRQDLAELKKILELAQRPKIKDFLTIEIRRQETKLADLIEKEDVSKKDEKIPKTIVAQTKTYDYVIRNYCKGNWFKRPSLSRVLRSYVRHFMNLYYSVINVYVNINHARVGNIFFISPRPLHIIP